MTIIEVPLAFEAQLTDVTSCRNTTASFTCRLNRPSATELQWSRNGKSLRIDGKKYSVSLANAEYTLNVGKVSEEDAGEYTVCLPGKKYSTATLNVERMLLY